MARTSKAATLNRPVSGHRSGFMKHICLTVLFTILAIAMPAFADSRIKIDTVPADYTPTYSIAQQPVYLNKYHFEVSEETGRARVVVTYTYAENMIAGKGDPGGPPTTRAQIPGLVYDAQNHTVVYNVDGKQTVCATVQESNGFWGHHSKVINTNACTVSTEPTNATYDDGWDLHHRRMLNTYLDIR
jgi:hypothetical protein